MNRELEEKIEDTGMGEVGERMRESGKGSPEEQTERITGMVNHVFGHLQHHVAVALCSSSPIFLYYDASPPRSHRSFKQPHETTPIRSLCPPTRKRVVRSTSSRPCRFPTPADALHDANIAHH